MEVFIYIVIALAVGFVVGRRQRYARSFQNSGEARLRQLIRENFQAPDYHLMNHITLRLEDGTTQIDHILISKLGVFVIETKNYQGWLFANARQASWTQVLFYKKFKFQNPIFQNLRHVRAVQRLLDFLPPEATRSIVVFTGGARFKTEAPIGVFTLSGLVEHIRNETTEVMSYNRMQFCVGRLETARLAITAETDVEHIRNLERRHGGTP